MPFVRITITSINASKKDSLNDELQKFGAAIGLFNLRDRDKSCFRIFILLIRAMKEKKGLTSDELAFAAHLTRATVIHHLNKLMESGIVSSIRGRYFLNVSNLEELVELMQRNVNNAFEDLKGMARNIDDKLEL